MCYGTRQRSIQTAALFILESSLSIDHRNPEVFRGSPQIIKRLIENSYSGIRNKKKTENQSFLSLPRRGIEPPTYCLGGNRSIQLSYRSSKTDSNGPGTCCQWDWILGTNQNNVRKNESSDAKNILDKDNN